MENTLSARPGALLKLVIESKICKIIKANGNTFKGRNSYLFQLYLPFKWESTLKAKNLLLMEQILSFKGRFCFGRIRLPRELITRMDGWMDDLRFYILFNSISVISGRCSADNERLCAMELRLRLRRFHLE